MSNQHTVSEHSEEQQHTKERIIAAASKVLAEKGYDGQCRNVQDGDDRKPIRSSFSGMTNADSHDSDHIPTLPCKIGPPFGSPHGMRNEV
ncbi:MAG: hypothetical protein ACJ8DI_22170 [Ktedonobacteraceae bacterium]